MVNSRQKGKRGELYVVKLLKANFGDGFRRSGPGFKGKDILVPEGFPFSVECKDHASTRACWFFKPTADLEDWWRQTVRQASTEGRKPLLAVKAESTWYAIVRTGDCLNTDYVLKTKIGGEAVDVTPLVSFSYGDK